MSASFTVFIWECPRGVMVKAMDCGIVDKRVRTPVALLRSLSGKYPGERYEPPYPPTNGSHYCSSRRMALALNTYKGWYVIKAKKPNITKIFINNTFTSND